MSEGKAVLHICCAPDATVPWKSLADEGFDVTGFFYGNNIHPAEEWERRRDAVIKLAGIYAMNVSAAEYNSAEWLDETARLADEPEGGKRCAECFRLQLTAAANFAARCGAGCLCTTLTISPHKDPSLINETGRVICELIDIKNKNKIKWLPRIWRKNDGFRKSVALSKSFGLYRQNYCGCGYSMRVTEEVMKNERQRKIA
jgi:predicted adenine nucleotide alpha hydrolase (AANH) superfamily ATPase